MLTFMLCEKMHDDGIRVHPYQSKYFRPINYVKEWVCFSVLKLMVILVHTKIYCDPIIYNFSSWRQFNS